MKKLLTITVLAWFCLAVTTGSLYARDMRQAAVEAKKQLTQARQGAKTLDKEIRGDKAALLKRINALEAQKAALNADIADQTEKITHLAGENKKLEETAAQGQAELDELSGAVRVAASNLKGLLTASVYTARDKSRLDKLAPILDTSRFPGLDDMQAMAALFMEETRLSAGIDLAPMPFVSDTGEQVTGEVLTLGGFTSAYRFGGKTGFLNYSPEAGRLYALSALPKKGIQKNIASYMDGESDSFYIDISKGGALRQITHRQTLMDQIEKGGYWYGPSLPWGYLPWSSALNAAFS